VAVAIDRFTVLTVSVVIWGAYCNYCDSVIGGAYCSYSDSGDGGAYPAY